MASQSVKPVRQALQRDRGVRHTYRHPEGMRHENMAPSQVEKDGFFQGNPLERNQGVSYRSQLSDVVTKYLSYLTYKEKRLLTGLEFQSVVR